MSLQCGSQGALTEIAVVEAGGEFGEESERYDFVAEDLHLNESIVGMQGLTGKLDLFADHRRRSVGYVSGGIMMNVSALELERWLPRILRGSKVSDTHFPGDEKRAVDILVKRDKATFLYTGLEVDKAFFRAAATSQEPSLMEMMLTFVGVDEAEGEWPAEPPARLRDNLLYWLQADSTLTLNETAYPFESFNLVFDNMLQPLMRNSLRPVCIRSEGRRVAFQPQLPLSADAIEDLYHTPLDAAGELVFESSKNLGDSDSETKFEFGRLFGRKVSPSTRGRTETFLRLDLGSYPGADEDDNPSLKISNKFPAEPEPDPDPTP